MEDSAIIELYWNRDETAIAETDKKYGAYCFAVADNILCDKQDAEECVSDTFLKAWGAMPPKRPDRLKLFLAKITRNLSFDRYKARNAGKRGEGEISAVLDELEECISGFSDTENEIEAGELQTIINSFLSSLSSRERDIFLRRYFYSETTERIAKRYLLRESNVLMILSRTRKKLRAELEKEGYDI